MTTRERSRVELREAGERRDSQRAARRRSHPESRTPIAPAIGAEKAGRPTWVDRLERSVLRLTVLTAYVGVLALVFLIVSPALPDSARFWEQQTAPPAATPPAAEATQPQQAPPPRPEGIPERIPTWAWEMHQWHLTPGGERGARPTEAPARLPAWYWEWRQWRLGLAGPAG